MAELVRDIAQLASRGCRMEIPFWVRPGGHSVLYMHGMGVLSSDWIGSIYEEEFAGATLVGFEAPGAGNSQCATHETLQIDDIVAVARHLVNRLQLGPVSLVGHSLGGVASLLFACTWPEDVACFVNIEGNLTPQDCFFSQFVVDAMADIPRERFFDVLEDRIRLERHPEFIRYAERLRDNVSEAAYRSYSRSLVAYSSHGFLLERFLGLNVPRLFVRGADNPSPFYLPLLRQRGIAIEAIPGSRHFPSYSNPGYLYKKVAHFIARHVSQSCSFRP